METTNNGIQKAQFQEINIASFNNNATILDEHLSNKDIHVNACNIAGVTEADELKQIDFTDTNSTMWGKIKKSLSEVANHVNKISSEITLGHVKIGTGLQMTDDVASVKIANDLKTDDSTTTLSAAMGVELSNSLNIQSGEVTMKNAWSSSNIHFKLTKQGNRVHLCGLFYPGTLSAKTVILSLPDGFFPSDINVPVLMQCYDGTSGVAFATPSGNIVLAGEDYLSSAPWYAVNVTWEVN